MTNITLQSNLGKNIDLLLRGNGKEFDAYLSEIISKVPVPDTNATLHCYVVNHDGNDNPRVNDLAQAVALRMIDYCIPRSEIKRAKEKDQQDNTTVEVAKLKIKARKLFTDIENTGEGGEMLLYMLTQAFLRIPQFLCKMPLKTSSQMHYHGADGVHIKYDNQTQKLALYWGESKLYSSIEDGLSACFDSIMPFLIDTGGTDSSQFRDLQLITGNIDVLDDELEVALLNYLDPDSPFFNKLQYRGICLVGFDEESYPNSPNQKTIDQVISEVKLKYDEWQKKVRRRLRSRESLDRIIIEVFLLPFPSVGNFRKSFLEELKYV
ncbi:hypothetical protein AZ66_19285 [Paenibacillus sp. E194]|uniref:HamA C-terminal domain-containing protein n=1 Tax=Paenibacillus sp. E194 TaxID=1458845 RepID=UPI0005E75111|nr:DUF1837 domain-containing protein [Paenibacillus sp. E194]KJB86368.1 hypothetical protein AZ66_19285 [Paenibacillus sp. E194]